MPLATGYISIGRLYIEPYISATVPAGHMVRVHGFAPKALCRAAVSGFLELSREGQADPAKTRPRPGL